jgi:Zn-dependent peptidase ImmA (M78 family)
LRLAKALDVPVEFFAAGRPIGELDAAEAHFRSLRSTRAADRARAAAFVEQVWELSFALERHVRFPEADLLQFGEGTSPQVAAQEMRERWGIGPGPFAHLVATMEAHGVIVCLLSMTSRDVARVDAFSTNSLGRPIVVVTPDRADNVFRHRFTCAHELGHLVLHPDVTPGDLQQEREADAFAAELLTPAAQIQAFLPPTVNLATLDRLSRRWGVSTSSLVRRMTELRGVSEASARRAYQRLRASQSLKVEEPVSTYPGELPSLLSEAQAMAEQYGYSLGQLAQDLRWKTHRVRELLGRVDERPSLRLLPDTPQEN